jgi:1-acyl-sn-glycerol-3-phosphate acyltransferase
MGDGRRSRWSRRFKTIPAMLAATVVAFAVAPLFVPAAVVYDLIGGRLRLPTVRVYLFALQYLFNDSAEILAAPVLWIGAGFGTTLASPSSVQRHERLQWWSVRLLQRRAEQLLGLRLQEGPGTDEAIETAAGNGPVIVVARHVSWFDASLPALLFQPLGFRLRGVIMAEMLADPGFDLIYSRTGSVFVSRDRGPEAAASLTKMAATADNTTALIIFPEGRLFSPTVLRRSIERLTNTDPERAEALASMTKVLPPRAAGLSALLDAAPDSDVLILRHRGYEQLAELGRLVSVVPLAEPITVEVRRVARADIPDDYDGRVRWLDQIWLAEDRALAAVDAEP